MKRPETLYLVTACGEHRCGQEGGRGYLLSANHLPGKMPVVNAGHLRLGRAIHPHGEAKPPRVSNVTQRGVTQGGGDAET